MKFGSESATLELSEGFEVKESGIGDMGIIFQILSGLYNDPQRIIVQEYVANARDAHREVGKSEVPIEITLPTNLQSELSIRDFGPGISPDRMNNVFINYGASTKRGDNLQTGGFGIGAKSVFCYTDCCTIETWVDGFYYNYSYMVGEDKKPKCIPMDKQESNEPNGTKISINISTNDINVVCSNVYFVTQYWSVRPNIINGDSYYGRKYQEYKVLASGNKWQFLNNRNSKCHVIIDEIPYKFDFDSVFKDQEEREKYGPIFQSGNFDFVVNTGEVTMSPNREGPIYDPMTRKCFKSIVENAYSEIEKNIIDDFGTVVSIFDAFDMYNKYTVFKNIVRNINWRGFPLSRDRIFLSQSFYKIFSVSISRRGNKPVANYCSDIPAKRTATYIFNDEVDENGDFIISPARLKTIVNNHDRYEGIYIFQQVKYDPKYHKEYLTEADYDTALEEYDKEINIDSFNLKLITSFEKYKAPRSERSEKVNIYEFNSHGNPARPTTNWNGINVNFEDIEGYFVEFERGTPVGYTINILQQICKMFKITVYGVPKRYIKVAEKIETLTPLNDYLTDQLENLKKYVETNNDIIFSIQNVSNSCNKHSTFRRLDPTTKSIMVNCPDARAYFDASDDVETMSKMPCDIEVLNKLDLLKGVLNVNINTIITPKYDLNKMIDDIIKKYPLVDTINRYDLTNNHITHLNHYLEYLILHKDKIQSSLINSNP